MLLDTPTDKSEIDDKITGLDVGPVENLTKWDLTGTVFYRTSTEESRATVRRWFLVNIERLDSGDAKAEVEVYDQLFRGIASLGPVGPPTATDQQTLEKSSMNPITIHHYHGEVTGSNSGLQNGLRKIRQTHCCHNR